MVIFGAGASYDSVPSRQPSTHKRGALPTRPPLADELFLPEGLFAESLQSFRRVSPIVPYLQAHNPQVTIEHRLEELQAEGESDPERKRQIAAVRFYLHFMIAQCEHEWNEVAAGVTNYVTLLDQLRRSRGTDPVLLATFNYDRLSRMPSSLLISTSQTFRITFGMTHSNFSSYTGPLIGHGR